MSNNSEAASSAVDGGKKVVIVGAGLVGALDACYFAQRGFSTEVYESRNDPRNETRSVGRSINLAMSNRALDALQRVGLEEAVRAIAIPMHARMIHDKRSGRTHAIAYGKKGQYIMAIDRKSLNVLLINEAEKHANIKLYFNHKLVACDFDQNRAKFNFKSETVETDYRLIIGNDGAFSAVRNEIARKSLFQYAQQYIDHGYIELRFQPTADGKFCMPPNYLHIWPRNDFMLIALPNTDFSFTGTLFIPFKMFEAITTDDELMHFFEENFCDAIEFIGRKELCETFFSVKPSWLISIKCSPYDFDGKALLMGDAAHAMVPFYGQGMNCGFEDVLIFHEILESTQNDFKKALPMFSEKRIEDDHTINDLALYNYIEMRKNVNSPLFIVRKKFDNLLHSILGSRWIPLYTMVAFTRIPYSQCMKHRKLQDKIISKTLKYSGIILVSMICGHWINRHKLYVLKLAYNYLKVYDAYLRF